MTQQMIDDAQRALDAVVRDARTAGAKHVSSELVSGVPWTEIVGQLEQQAFDLCVIGTHGRSGLDRVLLGSVAEKVVRHAPCSVLVVRPTGDVKPLAHVLVATDFSAHVQHALELAPRLVPQHGAITLLHVIEAPVAYAGEVSIADFARDLDKRAATALDDTARRLRSQTSVPVTIRSRIGNVRVLTSNTSLNAVSTNARRTVPERSRYRNSELIVLPSGPLVGASRWPRRVPLPSSRSDRPHLVGNRRADLVPQARHPDPTSSPSHDAVSRHLGFGPSLARPRGSHAHPAHRAGRRQPADGHDVGAPARLGLAPTPRVGSGRHHLPTLR
jgi:nucleotide-binding universal stress UspA family protein